MKQGCLQENFELIELLNSEIGLKEQELHTDKDI
jgi:hypothetical protein